MQVLDSWFGRPKLFKLLKHGRWSYTSDTTDAAEFLMLLFRVLRPLRNRLRGQARHGLGLGPSHFIALRIIIKDGAEGGTRISDVARKLQLSPAAVTQMVTELEHRGLAEREHGTVDRRVVLVKPTPEALKVLEEHRQQAVAAAQSILDGLDTADREALVRILRHLDQKLDTVDGQG